jgi:hypothetical protein
LPDTVPIAVNCSVTLAFTSGATMRGCAILRVSVPVEGGALVELDVVEELEVSVEDVVDDFETAGIST